MTAHCAPIILAAAQNDVPAVYGDSVFARAGGLLAYGPDPVDTLRRAATYVPVLASGSRRVLTEP